ncbi:MULTISPECIES: DUF1934 domain-containing protein [unclassified Paenibacillus]|uniref:DUF1934 domain-containing protein n=1 Tax=unclassified Paenibacillus TaxID=185978 RepID=UPI0004F656A3|nr:DUF1934 domain-containing protein [Paenibacillus sp. FSL H7-0357]AIQ15378.1 hypothetical protein H70357_00570 [Paenibacillus sp. FSL H7-0357]
MAEVQSDKYGVSVTLESLQDGQRNVVKAAGEVTARGPQLYIRYEESSQGPQGEAVSVRTTIKISDSELKLIRHGGIQSEQSFAPGRRLPGFYRSPYTQFNLSTETRKLDMVRNGRSLTVSWEYDLYVYEELSGQFAISLHIQEEPQS